MFTLPVVSWTFPGIAPENHAAFTNWPRWVIALNFACDSDHMVIHDFEGRLTAYVGDTIHRTTNGRMTVTRAPNSDRR